MRQKIALSSISLVSLAAAVTIALPTAGVAKTAQPLSSATTSKAEQENARLLALFARSDEDKLANSPIEAMFRGDMRYADQFGDYISDAYYQHQRDQVNSELAELATIDRSLLSPINALAAEVFALSLQRTAEELTPDMVALSAVRPVDHFRGFHTFYPTFSSGKSAAPFNTVTDYENALKRHDGYIRYMGAAIDRFKEGMASDVFETKLTIGIVIQQLDNQLATPIDDSPYMGPTKMFPAQFSDAEKARFTDEYRAKTEEIYAANKNLRDFLANEYLPVAREGVGLSAMKGGAEYYNMLIKSHTTLPLTADEIHAIGLSEVARIKGDMETVMGEAGFKGSLAEFFQFVRDDPQFQPQSREWLSDEFYKVGKEVDSRVGKLFKTLPKAPLEIKPYEPFREQFQAGGSYEPGTPDGSRPGTFWFNAYDLPSRSVPGITTLYLHEGAPGHHFQISLAQENEALPNFMRFGGNTAYVEGWALYAETLGYDMGFYDNNPYQKYGQLDDEMLRAMRLVVDTGLHSKGWTRDQAIQYMLDNSAMGKTDATAEVERYIAMPGQALAYKIGALTIQRLRKKAETELGADFDIREFHEQLLNTGALPLPVLESKIDRWIKSQIG